MNSETPFDPPDRLQELLADRALFGLDAAEQAELRRLVGDASAEENWERFAAELQLSLLPAELEPLPAHVARQIAAAAKTSLPIMATRSEEKSHRRSWLTWTLSAACLAMFVMLLRTPGKPPSIATLTPSERRAELLKDSPDAVQIGWTATGEAHGPQATGDVVWSTARQEGYLRFRDLQINNPAVEQYQLWIFDAEQDERYPVDGGVFDITSAGEVVIPIHAKLRVMNPTLFAITVEKPGGVVVSDRSKLPLLAKVEDRLPRAAAVEPKKAIIVRASNARSPSRS